MKKLILAASMFAFPSFAQHPVVASPPPRGGVVVAPPAPGVVVRRGVVGGVRVNLAPPPLREEIRPAAPSANHTWIGGHWGWRGGQHVWLGGTWVMPPEQGMFWEPAQWVNEGGSYMFYEGHWRAPEVRPEVVYEPPPQPQQPIEVEVAPPEPILEVRPSLPFEGAVWIPGYWNWHGSRHVWVGGRWTAPRPGHVWVEGGWDRGERGHYRYRQGYWRR